MFLSPFEHQRQCAAWKASLDYLQRSDINQGFVFRRTAHESEAARDPSRTSESGCHRRC